MKSFIFPLVLISTLVFYSCNNYSEKESVAALDPSTSYTGVTGDSAKLVKSGSLQVKVKDIENGTREISSLAKKLGGMVYDQSLNYTETGRNELKLSRDSLMVVIVFQPQADLTVRVPSEHLEEFMYGVTDMGYFTNSRRLEIDDKSLVYLENILKQKNRTAALANPYAGKDKSLSDRQAIDTRNQVTDKLIANKYIDADANYSVVNLALLQNAIVKKETIANYIVSDYNLPFGQRLGIALGNGWQFFLNFVLVLANLWMFIIAVTAALLLYRIWQQQRRVLRS